MTNIHTYALEKTTQVVIYSTQNFLTYSMVPPIYFHATFYHTTITQSNAVHLFHMSYYNSSLWRITVTGSYTVGRRVNTRENSSRTYSACLTIIGFKFVCINHSVRIV